MAAAIGIPIVVQDEPVTTGVLMSPELLVRIATEIPACRYVKLEEPPTPTKITAMRRLPGGAGVRIFGGMNAMYFYEELSRGAVGIMTGAAVPDVLVEIQTAFDRGDRAAAAAIFDRYASYIRYEGQQGVGLALRKEVLRLRGAIADERRAPAGPVPRRRDPPGARRHPGAGRGQTLTSKQFWRRASIPSRNCLEVKV